MRRRVLLKSGVVCTFFALSLTLGCGGGGGGGGSSSAGSSAPSGDSTPAAQGISGVVADGYLKGAKVCLDKEGNKLCNPNEPSAITNADGTYTLNVSSADAASYPILVAVPADAVDSDTGAAVGNGYVMTAPAGSAGFVSPLTTMVHNFMEENPSVPLEDAEKYVKDNLGVSSDVDLFKDYVKEEQASPKNDYKKMHNVAKVIASALGDGMKTVVSAFGGDFSRVGGYKGPVKYITRKALENLKTIKDNVPDDKDLSAGEVKELTGSSTASALKVDQSDIAILGQSKELLAPRSKSSFGDAVAEGVYWFDNTFQYGFVKAGASANTLAAEKKFYNSVSGKWEALSDYQDYILTGSGWQLITESPNGLTVTYDGATAILTDSAGYKTKAVAAKVDISGNPHADSLLQLIHSGKVEDVLPNLKDANAKFPAGSSLYNIIFTPLQDVYSLWADESGWTNKVTYRDDTAQQNKDITSLSQLLAVFADTALVIKRNLAIQFAGSGAGGTVTCLDLSTGMPIQLQKNGAWEIRTVYGQQILVVKIPDEYKKIYMDWDEVNYDRIYAVLNNVVKSGYVEYGNSVSEERRMINKAAFDSLFANVRTS